MSDKIKNVIVILLAGTIVFGLFSFCLIKQPNEISLSERRPLQQFPEVNESALLSGKFMKEFDEYAVDQFPFREYFRRLYADVTTEVFCQSDMEGLYLFDDMAVAKEYPLNDKSLDHAVSVFNRIYESYLKGKSGNIYFSVIPDKNYFLRENNSLLSMDYDKLFDKLKNELDYMEYIDITHLLELDDYYKTDPHWRQEKITDVAEYLADSMNTHIGNKYEKIEIQDEFYGTYCGQAAKPLPSEKMYCLENEVINQCKVYDYQNNKEIGMYDSEKAKGRDPYAAYLSGPISYITIENPSADNKKELIIFRDSFTSSIAPLLAEGYSKITLLDIRYLPSYSLGTLVDFEDKDVLFLYSSSVLNHSETLK